jgi:hypothetical protein
MLPFDGNSECPLRTTSTVAAGESDQLADIVVDAATHLGARLAGVFLMDYGQRQLQHLASAKSATVLPLDVEGSLCGRAFRRVEVLSTAYETGWRLLLPILDGVDRLGVLRLTFPPTVTDAPGLRQRCVEFAALLGELLIGKGQYGDALQRVVRTETMAIAAEMQWQLLPPLTFGADRVVITGRVEPCYSVGGTSSTTPSTATPRASPSSMRWGTDWAPVCSLR